MASTTKTDDALDQLKQVSADLLSSLGQKMMSSAGDRVSGMTDKLNDVAGGGPIGKAVEKGTEAKVEGKSPVAGGLKGAVTGVKDKVAEKLGGGGGKESGGGKETKSTNIVESIDVGVPVKVAYNQWTEFGAFPSFMKKVENAEAVDDNKINFKAQIFLSHRSWEATILEQIPDERIVWRSKGQKGHVDGAVTFHELGPNLTRILVVLEYYPQGLFEKTGNIWEAQGRRARAEIRHFRRHVMTRTILDPEEVEGWRGRIEDGEVVESHEDALEREQEEAEQEEYGAEDGAEDEAPEDEYSDEEESDEEESDDDLPEDEDEYSEEEPEDEYSEEEESDEEAPEDEYEDEVEEEPEDEADEEAEDEDYVEEEAEDEPEEEEERPARRRRAS